ncbi:hypothetical protein [Streptomyces sp. NPDC088925]|uniref:hypothetical protein n=1 Tax=Streptomyces sp. NPDC088925 TaxID=3365914 RepID=UPI0037FDB359
MSGGTAVIEILLFIAVVFSLGLAVLVVEHLRWSRRNARVHCMTCGQYHTPRHPHAKH